MIRLDGWATIEDIRAKFKIIEGLQKGLWGKQEEKHNFRRDMVWYDFATQYKLKPKEIAKLWIERFPQDIDLLTVRRIRGQIDKEDPQAKELRDSKLLEEIRSGFLSSKYGEWFEEERVFYITGKNQGKDIVITEAIPFLKVVREAIRRMKQQIEQVNTPPKPTRKWIPQTSPPRLYRMKE